jgi:hypothetical protein
MQADRDALAMPCPTCGARPEEVCAGVDGRSHTSRVARLQEVARMGQPAHTDEERATVRTIIDGIRQGMRDRGHGR